VNFKTVEKNYLGLGLGLSLGSGGGGGSLLLSSSGSSGLSLGSSVVLLGLLGSAKATKTSKRVGESTHASLASRGGSGLGGRGSSLGCGGGGSRGGLANGGKLLEIIVLIKGLLGSSSPLGHGGSSGLGSWGSSSNGLGGRSGRSSGSSRGTTKRVAAAIGIESENSGVGGLLQSQSDNGSVRAFGR